MLDRVDDTIVAISSAPGQGEVGIVRLSGPAALGVAASLLRQNPDHTHLSACASGMRIRSGIPVGRDDGEVPAFVQVFRAPCSYTRQDVVELMLPGSDAILQAVVQRALTAGARHAAPGEFTARAFLSGRISLAEAEAVAALIRAQTSSQLRAANRLMEGYLSSAVGAVRDDLGALLALVEADIDFAEEPIDFIRPDQLSARLGALKGTLDRLNRESDSFERIERLPHVLLAGPPNAGKSTLMNVLAEAPRSICAAVAGTTRDILAAPVRLDGCDAMFLDSAGIEDSADHVVDAGVRAALERARSVDAICLVLDAGAEVSPALLDAVADANPAALLIVMNKVDLLPDSAKDGLARGPGVADDMARRLSRPAGSVVTMLTSAHTRTGMAALREALGSLVAAVHAPVAASRVVLTARQRDAVAQAAAAISRAEALARSADDTIDCADLVAFELRDGLDALGQIHGEVTTSQLLERIFADFCIGK